MDHQEWVPTPDYDKYVIDNVMVLVWHCDVVLWEDVPEVDKA